MYLRNKFAICYMKIYVDTSFYHTYTMKGYRYLKDYIFLETYIYIFIIFKINIYMTLN